MSKSLQSLDLISVSISNIRESLEKVQSYQVTVHNKYMMSKKTAEVTYKIARPHQLPQIQKLMYASFNKDEPMTRHLKLHQARPES